MASTSELLQILSTSDTLSAAELGLVLGVSQPTVSRLLRAARRDVLRIGKGRATRYALTRRVYSGFAMPQPLFSISEHGRPRELATLHGLSGGRYLVEDACDFWLMGEAGNGLFDDLPWFLQALRPQGFSGRMIASGLAASQGFAPDPDLWRSDDVLRYLVQHGADMPGHLVVGEAMAHHGGVMDDPVQDRVRTWPRQVRQILAGEYPGSSAGGDQPKFAATLAGDGGDRHSVIVKFSAPASGPVARRWRDLLVAEHHAQKRLAGQDGLGAETMLFDIKGRYYLESTRFDRTPSGGRSPSFPLQMVDAEYTGVGSGWTRTAHALNDRNLLSRTDLERVIWLDCFGAWIANNDRHLGNLAMAPTDNRFTLLPAYDMLPMLFRPARDEIVDRPYSIPAETRVNEHVWHITGQLALEYWRELADEDRLNDDFRRLATDISRRIAAALP